MAQAPLPNKDKITLDKINHLITLGKIKIILHRNNFTLGFGTTQHKLEALSHL